MSGLARQEGLCWCDGNGSDRPEWGGLRSVGTGKVGRGDLLVVTEGDQRWPMMVTCLVDGGVPVAVYLGGGGNAEIKKLAERREGCSSEGLFCYVLRVGDGEKVLVARVRGGGVIEVDYQYAPFSGRKLCMAVGTSLVERGLQERLEEIRRQRKMWGLAGRGGEIMTGLGVATMALGGPGGVLVGLAGVLGGAEAWCLARVVQEGLDKEEAGAVGWLWTERREQCRGLLGTVIGSITGFDERWLDLTGVEQAGMMVCRRPMV